jgi:hypothetical protein
MTIEQRLAKRERKVADFQASVKKPRTPSWRSRVCRGLMSGLYWRNADTLSPDDWIPGDPFPEPDEELV